MAEFGLSVAIATPFRADGTVDVPALCAHGLDLMSRGVEGITLFGTTGEGASFGHEERRIVLAGLTAAVAPETVIAGIFATATETAGAQIAQAVDLGVTRFLFAPPFYFKGLEDAALFEWMRAVIADAPEMTAFLPYNIPQVTGVPIPPGVLGRLCDAFPGRIAAVKDSSGNPASKDAYLAAGHTTVLIGDERLLPQAMREGAGGAISGMANLHPEAMRRIVDHASDEPALMAEVEAALAFPVIASIKTILARDREEPGWERMRPPLSPLGAEAKARLLAAADAARAA